MADTQRLNSAIAVDISADGDNWLPLIGRNSNQPTFNPTTQDATDTDGGGYGTTVITMQAAQLVVTFNSIINTGTPNPVHELIEATQGQFGEDAQLHVRYYDTDGGTDGWQYLAQVTVARANSGVSDLRAVTATFNSQGSTVTKLSSGDIATLVAARNAHVPVILAASPSAIAEGGIVEIKGMYFTGTVASTGVKFGATSATTWIVHNDYLITAVMPAGSAGSAAITVTNATGASATFPYTRGS